MASHWLGLDADIIEFVRWQDFNGLGSLGRPVNIGDDLKEVNETWWPCWKGVLRQLVLTCTAHGGLWLFAMNSSTMTAVAC